MARRRPGGAVCVLLKRLSWIGSVVSSLTLPSPAALPCTPCDWCHCTEKCLSYYLDVLLQLLRLARRLISRQVCAKLCYAWSLIPQVISWRLLFVGASPAGFHPAPASAGWPRVRQPGQAAGGGLVDWLRPPSVGDGGCNAVIRRTRCVAGDERTIPVCRRVGIAVWLSRSCFDLACEARLCLR